MLWLTKSLNFSPVVIGPSLWAISGNAIDLVVT